MEMQWKYSSLAKAMQDEILHKEPTLHGDENLSDT